jgi:hypothetical protein
VPAADCAGRGLFAVLAVTAIGTLREGDLSDRATSAVLATMASRSPADVLGDRSRGDARVVQTASASPADRSRASTPPAAGTRCLSYEAVRA